MNFGTMFNRYFASWPCDHVQIINLLNGYDQGMPQDQYYFAGARVVICTQFFNHIHLQLASFLPPPMYSNVVLTATPVNHVFAFFSFLASFLTTKEKLLMRS